MTYSLSTWRGWARRLKAEIYALYLAYRDPRVPWGARLLAGLVVAYAFSPIDLIPDPIPILGYLDDLILLPIGIWLVLKWIPADVMAECRARAQIAMQQGKPVNWTAAVVIVALWLVLAAVTIRWLWHIIT
ncbi:MAG: YkvA family protein [Caldilineaceae bacterium]